VRCARVAFAEVAEGEMNQETERAISAILRDQENAWKRGDARAFSQHMADGFLAINVQGQTMSGKEVFDRQHAFIFGGIFKGSTMSQTIDTLRQLSENTAFVETVVHVSDLIDPPPVWPLDPEGRLETRLLQVFEKAAGKWSVIAYHNTIVNHRAPPVVA
jgi:uncharacterized protein (TIGR02246 family)